MALGEQHSPKTVTAKPTLPSVFYRALGKAFAKCPTLGKVETEKNPKKWEFLPEKNGIFLIDGGPHRPAPTHLRHFSREFHGYAADAHGYAVNAIRTRDLPLCTYLLYHYTIFSLVSGFYFSSQYIILNRV